MPYYWCLFSLISLSHLCVGLFYVGLCSSCDRKHISERFANVFVRLFVQVVESIVVFNQSLGKLVGVFVHELHWQATTHNLVLCRWGSSLVVYSWTAILTPPHPPLMSSSSSPSSSNCNTKKRHVCFCGKEVCCKIERQTSLTCSSRLYTSVERRIRKFNRPREREYKKKKSALAPLAWLSISDSPSPLQTCMRAGLRTLDPFRDSMFNLILLKCSSLWRCLSWLQP